MLIILFSVFVSTAVLVVGAANPRALAWMLLLWIPVMGWVQLNVFNDSSVTVLIYEVLIIAMYAAFAVQAARSPETYGIPPVVWRALPFVVWCIVLIPGSIAANGVVVTLIGLRTYLLPLGLVWIGYRAFERRQQLERLSWALMLQLPLIGALTATQVLGLTSMTGSGIVASDIPIGFMIAGIIRPPGTFSAPGHLGNYLLFSIPFAMGLLAMRARISTRVVYTAGLVGAIAALVANTQRTTMTLLILIVPVMIVLVRRVRGVSTLVVAVGVLIVGLTAGNEIMRSMFLDRFASIQNDLYPTVVESPMRAMRQALQTPVLGDGLGTASPGYARLANPRGLQTISAADMVDPSLLPAEQFIAAVVAQTGIPGLLLFALFVGALLKAGWQSLRVCLRTDLGMLAAAIFMFQIATCLQSWSYSPLHYPPGRVLFWFWGGVLLALPRLAAQRAAHPPVALQTHVASAPVWNGRRLAAPHRQMPSAPMAAVADRTRRVPPRS